MPYVDSAGVRIFYEVVGQGPPIIFAHGGTSTMDSWKEGPFIRDLADTHTLILYDARGHGESDKPHDHEAYDIRLMASDTLAVLDAVGVARAHVWGYSMGGWTGFQLAKDAPDRLRSLILGGTRPMSDPEPLDAPADPMLSLMREGIASGADAVVHGMRALFGDISPEYEGRLRRLDYQAMVALMEHITYYSTSQSAILPTIAVPCLVYMSEADDPGFVVTNAWVSQIADATFVAIKGSHVTGDPEAEVAAARAFLARVDAA